MERDPRTDPRAGDVVHMTLTGNVEVISRDGPEVLWRYPEGPEGEYRWNLRGWGNAFSRATVIRKAEDHG